MAKKKKPTAADLQSVVKQILHGRSTLPSLDDLVRSLLLQFGGFENFAAEYKKQYDNTESDTVRRGMLDNLMKLILKSSDERPPQDLGGLSQEDLEAAAAEAIAGMAMETADGDVDQQLDGSGGPGDTADPGAGAGEEEAGEAEEAAASAASP